MVSRKTWDVAVIGAGPAGSTASALLADAGMEVVLLDACHFPRSKPCGGALSKKVKKFLPIPVETLQGKEVYGAEFSFKGKHRFRIETETPIAKLVQREKFDQKLLEFSKKYGADFHEGEKIVSIHREKSRYLLMTRKGDRIRTRFVIGADGPRGVSARFLNPGHGVPMGATIEEEIIIEGMDRQRLVYLDFGRFPWGYGWIFPKEGTSSVGCGAVPRKEKVFLKREYEAMKRAYGISHVPAGIRRGWLMPYYGDFPYHRVGERILLVGDAARFMDPFLGEGIYYALASGTFAAEAILKSIKKGVDAGRTYLSFARQEILEELTHAARMAEFIYPRIRLGFFALKKSHQLGRLYVEVMSGKLAYRTFNKSLFQTLKVAGRKKLTRIFSQ